MTTLEILQLTPEQKTAGIFIHGDKINGEYMRWHDNGQLCMNSFYLNGQRQGEYMRWYSNGLLREHCFYLNGEYHGEYKRWYGGGQLAAHRIYKNGKIVRVIV